MRSSVTERRSYETCRALLVCCAETVFFIHNVTGLNLEDLLRVLETPCFDVWKLIPQFR